ncbi:hypothetical protein HanPI659440_Chr08g0302131 [Helianthus annuus]|nr:hypothetical protein HanPI659440_Chr08g0302131 [Helianthus annuus]
MMVVVRQERTESGRWQVVVWGWSWWCGVGCGWWCCEGWVVAGGGAGGGRW